MSWINVSRRAVNHMRTVQDFRDRQLELLPHALQRPGFYCGAHGDLFYGTIIHDLAWLDERSQAEVEFADELLSGSQRVFGQFWYQNHKRPDHYQNEVASVYAQVAFRLGYFKPERVLTVEEFSGLDAALDGAFFSTDHTESELVSRFGKPSHDVLGGQTTVHCYACCDPKRHWIYFDYSRCYPPKDGVTYVWFDDPHLRDVRRTGSHFELLPFAEWFRPTNTCPEGG